MIALQEDLVPTVPVLVPLISVPRDQYSQAWLAWFMISFGGFAALEAYAVRQNAHERTLSYHTRRIFGIYPKRSWAPVGRVGVAMFVGGFCGWFVHHIVHWDGPEKSGPC